MIAHRRGGCTVSIKDARYNIDSQLAAAAITGFIAKENVVGTLAVCFVGLENLIDMEELALMEGAGAEVAGVMAITKVAVLAYLMFNLYTPPCFAAIAAMIAGVGVLIVNTGKKMKTEYNLNHVKN